MQSILYHIPQYHSTPSSPVGSHILYAYRNESSTLSCHDTTTLFHDTHKCPLRVHSRIYVDMRNDLDLGKQIYMGIQCRNLLHIGRIVQHQDHDCAYKHAMLDNHFF